MSPISKGLVSFGVALVLSSAAGAQGVVTQKNITLALAQTIANAAIAQCRSMGYKISVTVVDREGLPIVMMRDDDAGLNTQEGSDRKAYTARAFGQPSADFVKRLQDRPDTVGSRHIRGFWRSPVACRSKWATKSSALSASPAHPERTTSARRPESTRSQIN
jgi:hypothetical protein